LHITSGCSKDGHRNNIHNALVIELDRICRYSGLWSTREEYGAFRADLPNDNHRPDITIRNTDGLRTRADKIYIDVAVTCPLKGSQSCDIVAPGLAKANNKGRRAKQTYSDKLKHYNNILDEAAKNNPEDALAVRPGIQPFVFESTGLLHSESIKFLEQVADLASQTQKIGQENMVKFFKRRLSFCLQRAIGTAINTRARTLLGRKPFRSDRSFADPAIVENRAW
jgi:hypothetical protein